MSGETNAKDATSTSPGEPPRNAGATSGAASTVKKPLPEQNPAFKMMGLPRLRLPSRNWMIFLSVTGSIAGAITYDRWQTKRTREKWCNTVAHLADEHLPTKTLPRRVTVYLAAPPGDGLRGAREHFHTYVKPILVAAAMDWDVVEGRKEGDVRHKTAERIRLRRRRAGEGEPLPEDDSEQAVAAIRAKNGDVEYPGVAGDIIVGRHTWKEYIRGIHEGYLGPADLPKEAGEEASPAATTGEKDKPVELATTSTSTSTENAATQDPVSSLDDITAEASPSTDTDSPTAQPAEETTPPPAQPAAEEKPKRRFPAPPLTPADYATATLAPSTPAVLGPSTAIRYPHLLGIMNTRIRTQRYLNRRALQDDIGRAVAAAVLAAHRPYDTVAAADDSSSSYASSDGPSADADALPVSAARDVLRAEERDWYKKVRDPRLPHEESVWIEPVALDERIVARMRVFEVGMEDEERARRFAASGKSGKGKGQGKKGE